MDSFGTLRELARRHRDLYNQDAMANAEQFDTPEASNMFQPSVLTRRNLDAASSQADYAPQWDAWFEALNQAGGGRMPTIGGADKGPFAALRKLRVR